MTPVARYTPVGRLVAIDHWGISVLRTSILGKDGPPCTPPATMRVVPVHIEVTEARLVGIDFNPLSW